MAWNFRSQLQMLGPNAASPRWDAARCRTYCAWVARTHYENFSVASVLLPRRLLAPFHAVYAYCRWADDLGDETGGGPASLELLQWWRAQLRTCYQGDPTHPVMVALRQVIADYHIPPDPFLHLLEAFEQDQRVQTYDSMPQLLDYCRRSADPVGRVVLHLFGMHREELLPRSDAICTALQLTNFWQDVRRDWVDLRRIYLPRDLWERFGYTPEQFTLQQATPQFRALLEHLVEDAEARFAFGAGLLGQLPPAAAATIGLFVSGGRAILQQIRKLHYDVWGQRPRLEKKQKAGLILRAASGALKSRVGGMFRGGGGG